MLLEARLRPGRQRGLRFINKLGEPPMPDPNGTPETAPAPAAPAAPAEQPQAAPTPPVTTPAPAEVTTPAPEGSQTTPPAPATSTPEAPRESAAQKRARELREKTAGMTALADRLDPPAEIRAPQPAPPAPAPAAPSQPDYYDPETGDLDTAKLDAHTTKRAQEIARQVIAEERSKEKLQAARSGYVESVSRDAQAIATEYDELNPNSASYDAELDNHLDAMYQRATTDAQGRVIRVDIPLKDFVDREMKVIRKYRTQAQAAVPNTIAGQAVDGAVVPSSQAAKTVEKPYAQLSRKEREAKLGFARVKTPPTT